MLLGSQKGGLEWAVFAFYAISLIFVACFHEPWYDEAEAWQMARCGSLKDIFFYIPHYEGHPALWYLILAIPAKLGVPYELGLKSIACAAALCYGWLFLFKSPFPRVIRLLLPFHYFFFYQYGVISRPYGLSVLCFLLMAMAFRKRNQKPLLFILPMTFLCALSGYGVVLAGGICIAWVLEICKEKEWKIFTAGFWKDKRILQLLLLFIFAVLIILEIMPKADTYATAKTATNSIITRLIYTFFMMLPDSTVLTVLEGAAFLNMSKLAIPIVMVGMLVGTIMLCALVSYASKENLNYLIIPYALFSVFSSVVYFCAHHMGMMLAFVVFWLWIAAQDGEKLTIGKRLWAKVKLEQQDQKMLKKLGVFGLGILIAIPIYWTVAASILDIAGSYYYGRDMAKFLKETGLYQLKVMGEYDVTLPKDADENTDIYKYVNTTLIARPIAALPYFEHNFVCNLNMGRDDGGYALHRLPDSAENREVMEQWKELGMPDVIIGPMNLKYVFGDEVGSVKYVMVYKYAPFVDIWKAFTSKYNVAYHEFIYVREDLVEEYQLRPLSLEETY